MRQLIRNLLPFASLLALVVLLSILVPESFLTLDNFLNVFRRSSVYGIMAVGMTLIIISGGIDLSVGSLMALAGMIGSLGMMSFGDTGSGALLGMVVGMSIGMAGGFLNGVLVTRIRIQPFIVTLGTMSLFRGIALVMNDGQPYNVPGFKYLGEGAVFGIPISILIFILVAVLMFFILRYTVFGRHVYAIGSNKNAAFFAGISVDRHLLGVYTLSGLFVGLASMIAVSRTVSAQPTAGNGAELDVIAAVVIGGASLSGGRGTVLGTLVGMLLISFLRNGCTLLGISTNAQLIVIGAIIIAAVAVDQLARERVKEA